MMESQTGLPQYKCHKIVGAVKIAAMEIQKDGSAKIHPADGRYGIFTTKPGWAERFKGDENDPGYFVVYPDRYSSWSPSKAFEEGYTMLPDRPACPYPIDDERLVKDFTYHAPNQSQKDRYHCLRERAKGLAHQVMEFTPPSREQSLALTKIEEAVMWANAAIARNE